MDLAFLETLNPLVDEPFLEWLWWIISQPWAPVLLAVSILAWAYQYGRWRWVLAVILAVVLADLLSSQVLKPTFDRPRPCEELEWVLHPWGCGKDGSMPSSHAANAFAVAAAFGAVWPWGVALIVAIQRVVVGVHYPTDVIAGACVGMLCGMVGRHVVERAEALSSYFAATRSKRRR